MVRPDDASHQSAPQHTRTSAAATGGAGLRRAAAAPTAGAGAKVPQHHSNTQLLGREGQVSAEPLLYLLERGKGQCASTQQYASTHELTCCRDGKERAPQSHCCCACWSGKECATTHQLQGREGLVSAEPLLHLRHGTHRSYHGTNDVAHNNQHGTCMHRHK